MGHQRHIHLWKVDRNGSPRGPVRQRRPGFDLSNRGERLDRAKVLARGADRLYNHQTLLQMLAIRLPCCERYFLSNTDTSDTTSPFAFAPLAVSVKLLPSGAITRVLVRETLPFLFSTTVEW
jgi:hypothetical protein